MVKASTDLKRRFRKAKLNPANEKLTLKKFALKLKAEGDTVAEAWFAHKSRRFNHEAKQARIKNKGARIAAEKAATKMARRKKSERSRNKSGGSSEAKPEVKKV